MKIENCKENTSVRISLIGIGEAFIYNNDVLVRLPKYDDGSMSITVFKDSTLIPAWNVTKNNTSHFSDNAMVISINASLVIK